MHESWGRWLAPISERITATQDFSQATYRVASLSELAEQILGQT
ncbi:MAG: hypothetical protein OXJ53_15790 [Gammaproteobacteria bacterium]|nr:hypothetical protein [Gammaproteobacteria bacterium]